MDRGSCLRRNDGKRCGSRFLPSQERRETLWIEVPAFAGTTGNVVDRGSCLRRNDGKCCEPRFLPSQERREMLWAEVPAFAGTTGNVVGRGSCLRRNDGKCCGPRFLPSQERRVGFNIQVTDLFRGTRETLGDIVIANPDFSLHGRVEFHPYSRLECGFRPPQPGRE